MMTGWGRLEQIKLVSIPGMLQEQLQHMATDVELTEEIRLAVTVKMMCMAAAVVAVPQEVAVEDMQMGGQLWTITKMASLGIQRKQNGPAGNLRRYTGILAPTIEEAMPTDYAGSIIKSIGKSLRNVSSKDISILLVKHHGSIGNQTMSISTLMAGYQ